ncbi:MAG: hypothetical protein LCH61_12385 [Proteobacteria bacterium]|nr:hypothetical protein [Pseudomonadota bacterium]
MHITSIMSFPEAYTIELTSPVESELDLPRIVRSYRLGSGDGPYNLDGLKHALSRAAHQEPMPSEPIAGDAWDALAFVEIWAMDSGTQNRYQAVLAQIARELAVRAAIADARDSSDVVLKRKIMQRWSQHPALPFNQVVLAFLTEAITRDCVVLGLNPVSILFGPE